MPSRVKATNKRQVNLDLPSLKIQALSLQLETKGTSLTAEINSFTAGLYEKNVPKDTKNFIASMQGEAETGTAKK